jgi:co-chaperonin GroES (HSP10)
MKIRLLRGQVVVREDMSARFSRYTDLGLIVPDTVIAEERKRRWHRGRVLQMGAPALDEFGHEVPFGFDVGDQVIWHWITHEPSWTRPYVDGELACWLPQECIDAVIDPNPEWASER